MFFQLRRIIRGILHRCGYRKTIIDFLSYDDEKANYLLKPYLWECGWSRSALEKKCIDVNGNPMPWYPYPFIDFIASHLRKDLSIFEYGSGSSTLFFSSKAGSVHAVEHNRDWYEKVIKEMPGNVQLVFIELEYGGKYCQEVIRRNQQYDIILIDGRDRVNCIKLSLQALSPEGVIILDNSEREEYAEGINFLKDHNFRSLKFEGIAPGANTKQATMVFYRNGNCLEI